MKKLIAILGILLLLIVVVAAGLLWYANRYIQSPAFKKQLVAEISKATGGTVQIDTVSVSITSRIELGGIKFDRAIKEGGSQTFSTKKFVVKFNLWSILHKKIQIDEIYLESPDIKIVSVSKPSHVAAAETVPPGEKPPTPTEVPSPEKAVAPPAGAKEVPGPVAKKEFKLDLVLKSAQVKNGHLDITLPNGKRVVMENFDLQSTFLETVGPLQFNGKAHAESALLTNFLPLTDVNIVFEFENNDLTIKKATATVFRGNVEADGKVNLNKNQPFNLRVKWNDWDLKSLAQNKPQLANAIEGKVNGQGTFEGNFEHPLDLTGNGSITIDGAKADLPEFRVFFMAVQIKELNALAFNKCEADYTIGNQKINITRFEGDSSDLKLKGTGWMGFDETLDLNMHASLSPRLHTKIPNEVAAAFKKDPDEFYGMDFRIWNTLGDPKNDLEQRIGAAALGGAARTLIPEGIMNNTFDQLDRMLGGQPPSSTNAPPANTAPEKPKKGPADFLKELF